jgi:hypothetical protein
MYTNAQVTSILQYANISLYLGGQELAQERYYTWVNENPELDMIEVFTESVTANQPYYLGTNGFDLTVNYLVSLIGRWKQRAIEVSGNTQGVIAGQPSTSVLVPSTVLRLTYTATGGEISVTFSGGIGRSCYDLTRGGIDIQNILTYGTPTSGSNDVLWVSSTGVVTFGRALSAGEFIAIYLQ